MYSRAIVSTERGTFVPATTASNTCVEAGCPNSNHSKDLPPLLPETHGPWLQWYVPQHWMEPSLA